MTTTMTTAPQQRVGACCAVCPYRPSRVDWLLARIRDLVGEGWEPSEAMASVMGDPATHGNGFGPGMKRGLDDVADISRAVTAGHRTPEAIARFLCPFAVDD